MIVKDISIWSVENYFVWKFKQLIQTKEQEKNVLPGYYATIDALRDSILRRIISSVFAAPLHFNHSNATIIDS